MWAILLPSNRKFGTEPYNSNRMIQNVILPEELCRTVGGSEEHRPGRNMAIEITGKICSIYV